MPHQQEIDRFTLAFHRQAVERLRREPQLVDQALATLERWREQRGATASDAYLAQWRSLLLDGVDRIEREVCADDARAATLRGVSPLGFVLSAAERKALRQASGL